MILMTPEDLQADAGLRDFCQRWKVRELSLFGSVAEGRSHPASDYDLLVTFEPDADFGLLDHARMERELSELLGRPVDLVTRASIEQGHNPIRRRSILHSARTIYHAA